MAELADALDLGSSVHRRAGSSPVTRTKKKRSTLVLLFFFIQQAIGWQDLKATVKKTVRWTVFREGVDASILSYLCLISEVGSSERRKYVTHNHNEKYTSTSLFLYRLYNKCWGKKNRACQSSKLMVVTITYHITKSKNMCRSNLT